MIWDTLSTTPPIQQAASELGTAHRDRRPHVERKSGQRLLPFAAVVALAATALAQQPTIARLSAETRADASHPPVGARLNHTFLPLRDSALSRAAADALFARSNFPRTQLLAERALRRDAQDGEALFVRMELAGMESNYATSLDSAVRLCEAGAYARGDVRVELAAARVREAAANTPEFWRAIPAIQALLANTQESWPDLEVALLNAAMDGAPRLDPYALARAAGILTDWRIVGPTGSRAVSDVERRSISPADDLTQDFYAGRAVENFQFADGWIRLPNYLQRHGVFYAAGRFASLTAETRELRVESAGIVEVYVDGERVLRTDASHQRDAVRFDVVPGPHRVLLRFIASATPLRVAFSHAASFTRAPLPLRLSAQEAVYLLAAEHYAEGDFGAAVNQVQAEASPDLPAALQHLRKQAVGMSAVHSIDSVAAWPQLDAKLSPAFTTADPESWWVRRLAEHPSCDALRNALEFYGAHSLRAERDATQQKLEGCAPESLAYAQSLAQGGKHQQASDALRQLLAAAPLNRAARFMLIQQLQLSGDDEAAQAAAADWLRIAPNAPDYHRLAAAANDPGEAQPGGAFYLPYRRDAAPIARETANRASSSAPLVLLEDRVAIARPDGSVSLYVHTAQRWSPGEGMDGVAVARIPLEAQVLTLRILHADGTATAIDPTQRSGSHYTLVAGDTVDAEYVLNFTGDGGIPEHAEAFQFVFGSFGEQVLKARFIVLTPSDHGDGGVVITTGAAPRMTAKVRDGMLMRVWEKDNPDELRITGVGMPIVRVVEQENGWSVPSNAEHRKRIETIHPGPLPVDA